MINWFDMPTEGLSNGGQFEIKELTATENKVYQKDGEVYNKVTVNVEGGGGSSDFSTAEVTITDTVGVRIMAPNVNQDYQDAEGTFNPPVNTPTTYDIILYKGKAYCTIESEGAFNLEVTGNIENDSGELTITGNGTITIS